MSQSRRSVTTWGALLVGQLGLIAGYAAGAPPFPNQQSMAGMHMPASIAAAKAPTTVVLLHKRTVNVTIINFAFQPATLVVSPRTKIIWTNKDSDPHTVDSVKNEWQSDALDTDNRFARVFSKVGTFKYYCSVHPFMQATIVVRAK